ncbi:hypothetical protein F4778DRAFT_801841 [Xylariomycetidae sp. FL2044]|nr:hypothetical protein F4778DRAFT_801841 [Xylariomycetidae sp. FL2044]
MSSNTDNAMTRFLFAILRQKNLKDIDWNKVAHDPILAQEITNGHAARMRYSRFRSAMLGTEPTRRNRTGPPKARVTKSKKDPKGRKDGPENPKPEPEVDSPAPSIESSPAPSEPPAPRIKQENTSFGGYNMRLTPGLTPGPTSVPVPNPTAMSSAMANPPTIQPRFLTPCSDTDMRSSPALTSSPASEMVHSQNSCDYHPSPSPFPEPANSPWQPGHTYSAFAAPYPYDDFGRHPCDHQPMYPHLHSHLGFPNPSIESESDHVDVKHERWDYQ